MNSGSRASIRKVERKMNISYLNSKHMFLMGCLHSLRKFWLILKSSLQHEDSKERKHLPMGLNPWRFQDLDNNGRSMEDKCSRYDLDTFLTLLNTGNECNSLYLEKKISKIGLWMVDCIWICEKWEFFHLRSVLTKIRFRRCNYMW